MRVISFILVALLIVGAFAIHPGLGIVVAILSYSAMDGFRY